jgi:hypothetical protein
MHPRSVAMSRTRTRAASTHAHELGPTDEARIRARLREAVRERPLLAVGASGAVGLALGGLVFARAARLLFLAAVGYVANELWHREGARGIGALVDELSGAGRGRPESARR